MIRRFKEVYQILVNREFQQKRIAIINIYSAYIGTSKFIKQMLLNIKDQIDTDTREACDSSCSVSQKLITKKLTKEYHNGNPILSKYEINEFMWVFYPIWIGNKFF